MVSPKTGNIVPQVREQACAWKYIVAEGQQSETDGLPIFGTQKQGSIMPLCRPPPRFPRHQIFVQPMDVADKEQAQRNVQTAVAIVRKFGYRLSLQQHKVVGLP